MKILCEYYLLCTNLTYRATEHPVLGLVPTCERCAARHDLVTVALPR